MKVQCVSFYNEVTRQFEESSTWLTLNKEYIVLEVYFELERHASYRMVGDNLDQKAALYDARQFKIVSPTIPTNWVISQEGPYFFNLGPASWQELGFWEKCYDDEDPEALACYKREASIIYQQEA